MTSNQLVAVFNGSIRNASVQLCNARELHQFLDVKSDFRNWISNRITDYGFVENEDYIIVTERTAGRPRKEYHITLDMGKELGMVERNEKGRQIRKYFIAVEKQQKQNGSAHDSNQELLHLVLRLYGYALQFEKMYNTAIKSDSSLLFKNIELFLGNYGTAEGVLFRFKPDINADLNKAAEIIKQHALA